MLRLGDEIGEKVVVHHSTRVPVESLVALVIAAAAAAARVPIQVTALPLVVPLDRVLPANRVPTGQRGPAAQGARVAVRHDGELLVGTLLQHFGGDCGRGKY